MVVGKKNYNAGKVMFRFEKNPFIVWYIQILKASF